MYTTVILLVLFAAGLPTIGASESISTFEVLDLFSKAFMRTVTAPITFTEQKAKFSAEIMLANDVFTLDDALRLFIQQFLLGLYDGRYHLMPEDWETQFPAFARVLSGVNEILDLLGEHKLSEIGMKNIRPFVATLTPAAFADLQRLLKTLDDRANAADTEQEPIYRDDL